MPAAGQGQVRGYDDDYPRAAQKHVQDAEVLLGQHRFDGAGYLAGYVVECVLKALIQVETPDVPKKHDLNALSREALDFAGLPGSRTARYVRQPELTRLPYGAPGWHETLRYARPGTIAGEHAAEWVKEARRLYEEVVVRMRLDGVIK